MPRKFVTGGAKPPHQRRKSRTGGEFGLRIEEAGTMIGLSRSASYRAAVAGEIPTIKAGRTLIVPEATWLRMLGIDPPIMDCPAPKPEPEPDNSIQRTPC